MRMPSHKQKRERRRSRKHKRRSRSPARRKNEGKKENIPVNSSDWDTELRDLSCLVDNKREMIRQIFAAVGEDYLEKHTPIILKNKTIEELKKICFEELSQMSADVIFKVLEGIPCDTESSTSPGGHSQQIDRGCTSSKTCCGHATSGSSEGKYNILGEDCRKPEVVSSKGNDGMRCDEESSHSPEGLPLKRIKNSKTCCQHTSSDSSKRKRGLVNEKFKIPKDSSNEVDEDLSSEGSKSVAGESSAEERQSDSDEDDSCSSENGRSSAKCDWASSSDHPSITKKLAKVAPFHITFPKGDASETVTSNEEEAIGSDVDDGTSGETAELEMEEGAENEGNGRDSVMAETVVLATDVHAANQSVVMHEGEPEEQQSISEVVELEHRARAIRSMLSKIDIFQP
ncbi:caspase activity and apoptosis inhibitor 1-like isoform X3 [Ischnura elegans]|uniref:caspase activity and apoptosis inhibitor 1-like isoform X3 n=1 Tax=Ischnura elegans TaxID=197161 RepID=UPI001ED88650|nr:caspase activity and apoptosis inhibitor 1-like isoform X3 [Ischnura elegans]